MSSPLPLALLFSIYFMFVLFIGPRYMKDRKPMKLNGFTRAYNVYQIVVCTYFIEWAFNRGISYRDTFKCLKTNHEAESYSALCNHLWYFIMLRISELLETVVFVLRKKQNQVSTLHCYHHVSTVVILWLFLKYNPSE
jgi:GNS1/SUR4 family